MYVSESYVYLMPKEAIRGDLTQKFMFVSIHMGAGHQTQLLWKNSHCSETLSQVSSNRTQVLYLRKFIVYGIRLTSG